MIIHFKRLDGGLTADEFIAKIPINRTAVVYTKESLLVTTIQCVGIAGVLMQAKTAKKFFDCPVCKYQPEKEKENGT